jgi:hypothetical protein
MCKDRQQFAHCLQSIRAKYFWLKAFTTPSISSGACCFSHDRNSQFSSSRSRESCWILDRSVSIVGTATRFFRIIPASRSKAARHLSNNIRFARRRRNFPQQRDPMAWKRCPCVFASGRPEVTSSPFSRQHKKRGGCLGFGFGTWVLGWIFLSLELLTWRVALADSFANALPRRPCLENWYG